MLGTTTDYLFLGKTPTEPNNVVEMTTPEESVSDETKIAPKESVLDETKPSPFGAIEEIAMEAMMRMRTELDNLKLEHAKVLSENSKLIHSNERLICMLDNTMKLKLGTSFELSSTRKSA